MNSYKYDFIIKGVDRDLKEGERGWFVVIIIKNNKSPFLLPQCISLEARGHT